MEILLTCKYCNNKWVRTVYYGATIKDKCTTCGSTDLDVRDLSKTKLDGYVGCPPFPDKNEEKDDNKQMNDSEFNFWTDRRN